MPASLTAKGEARRQAMLDAVLRVLERGGPDAVTHRAVATEAGVPLAAATYYFSNVDDLLVSALRRATEEQVRILSALSDAPLATLAKSLVRYTHRDRRSAIAQYELLFLAMRRDSLREDAELWYRALGDAVRGHIPGDDRGSDERRKRVAWAIDGLMLQMLWSGEPATVTATQAALRTILGED